MCGIVGLFLPDRMITRAMVSAMNATIVHRGPDGAGLFVDAEVGIGIGMRRLSIIDLEGGWQPIANEDGRIHVVHNGEIYNYRELRDELLGLGHAFRTQSDTEVIVHAFEQWGGYEFANHLRGMFGIAVWDSVQRELWLVRDRLGIKPLFFADTPQGFAFGSEIKSLLASGVVDAEIDLQAIVDYFTFGTAGPGRSFVTSVRALLPGHLLRFQTSSRVCETRPYWKFEIQAERRQLSAHEAVELVRDKLRESVRMHLVSDVPVGAFLSGGVDSSGVVGLMAEAGCQPINTFSIGFEEDIYNELPYAREVAARWGFQHHERIVRPDAVAVIDRLLDHFDEPFADASAIPTWYLSELAAEHVKVVMSGDGGDELFGGYERYARAMSRSYLDKVPLELRRHGPWLGERLPAWCPGKYWLHLAAYDEIGRYLYELCLFPPTMQQRLLRPEILAAASSNPWQAMDAAVRGKATGDLLSKYLYLDTIQYLPLDILTKVDRMTMAHSLEARPPILDHELAELAASLPTEYKFGPRGRKYVLREAIRHLVPNSVLQRRKSGFSVPLQSWFAGPLRALFCDNVLSHGKSLDFLQAAAIRQLFEENQRGRRDHGFKLWAILMLELWLRRQAGLPRARSPQAIVTVG